MICRYCNLFLNTVIAINTISHRESLYHSCILIYGYWVLFLDHVTRLFLNINLILQPFRQRDITNSTLTHFFVELVRAFV